MKPGNRGRGRGGGGRGRGGGGRGGGGGGRGRGGGGGGRGRSSQSPGGVHKQLQPFKGNKQSPGNNKSFNAGNRQLATPKSGQNTPRSQSFNKSATPKQLAGSGKKPNFKQSQIKQAESEDDDDDDEEDENDSELEMESDEGESDEDLSPDVMQKLKKQKKDEGDAEEQEDESDEDGDDDDDDDEDIDDEDLDMDAIKKLMAEASDDEDDDDEGDDDEDDDEEDEDSEEENIATSTAKGIAELRQAAATQQAGKDSEKPATPAKKAGNKRPAEDDDDDEEEEEEAKEVATQPAKKAMRTGGDVTPRDGKRPAGVESKSKTPEAKKAKVEQPVAKPKVPATQATLNAIEKHVGAANRRTVFLQPVPRNCTQVMLKEFSKECVTARIPFNLHKRCTRLYAFLEYKDEATAKKNAQMLTGKLFNDAEVTANVCDSKVDISTINPYQLFVTNLPKEVDEAALRGLFPACDIVQIPRMADKTACGYAFIEFVDAGDALKALEAAGGKKLQDKEVKVAFGRAKTYQEAKLKEKIATYKARKAAEKEAKKQKKKEEQEAKAKAAPTDSPVKPDAKPGKGKKKKKGKGKKQAAEQKNVGQAA